MKKLLLIMFCMLACFAQAQQVTKTVHKKAVKTDVVTTGTMTIRKPDYICISTDNDRDLLIPPTVATTRSSIRSTMCLLPSSTVSPYLRLTI